MATPSTHAYWDHLSDSDRRALTDGFWMSHPAVRAYVNEEVTGDPGLWPLRWFQQSFTADLPFGTGLVVGCGTGKLERDLAQLGMVERLLAVDIGVSLTLRAGRAARETGLDHRIQYAAADAWSVLEGAAPGTFDAIFFHASLHHFERVGELLELVRSRLRPRGLLYLDEYVGPSADQWTWWRLLLPNLVYYGLPRRARRVGLVRAPINPLDPTEAVDSASILPAVERLFSVEARRDYGGALLSLIFSNLALATAPREEIDRAVRAMIRHERTLRRRFGLRPFYSLVVARAGSDAAPARSSGSHGPGRERRATPPTLSPKPTEEGPP